MTNAEYLIKRGIKFGKIVTADSRDHQYWEFYRVGGKTEGRIDKRRSGNMPEDAFKTWLDMEHEEPPALDGAEKRYLRAVIGPWRGNARKIEYIMKCEGTVSGRIIIRTYYGNMEFPSFDAGTMYKGMERGRQYSLEELGLRD